MRDVTAEGLEATIREYFDACNEADAEKMINCFEPDGVHYFPQKHPRVRSSARKQSLQVG